MKRLFLAAIFITLSPLYISAAMKTVANMLRLEKDTNEMPSLQDLAYLVIRLVINVKNRNFMIFFARSLMLHFSRSPQVKV